MTQEPSAAAFDAVAAHVAHADGSLSDTELCTSLALLVGRLDTQADAFELIDQLAQVAATSLRLAAQSMGTEPRHLLRAARHGALRATAV